MDREPEEFQSMGFFGIFKESFKLIVSWKKIFSQITLALILPLTFISLAQVQLSELLFPGFYHNESIPYRFQPGTPTDNQIQSSTTSELVAFWLLQTVGLIFSLFLSLLSTSAIFYTIACIYTSKLQMITFTEVMTVVPKVWKRLMVTFLWFWLIVFVYYVLGALLIGLVTVLFIFLIQQQVLLMVILFILLLCFVIGIFCIIVVWRLASVISVLEDIYGIKAITKSKELIKGKMWVASFTYLAILICSSLIQMVFMTVVVVHNYSTEGGLGIVSRVGLGFLCLVLLSVFILIGLVTQTVVYFVCKSYHHENIDKSWLADQLEEVYTGKYVQLETSDV